MGRLRSREVFGTKRAQLRTERQPQGYASLSQLLANACNSGLARYINGGMSGSPIITQDGAAIGVVSMSGGGADHNRHTEGGPNPHLAYHLPSRFRIGDRFGQLPADGRL